MSVSQTQCNAYGNSFFCSHSLTHSLSRCFRPAEKMHIFSCMGLHTIDRKMCAKDEQNYTHRVSGSTYHRKWISVVVVVVPVTFSSSFSILFCSIIRCQCIVKMHMPLVTIKKLTIFKRIHKNTKYARSNIFNRIY